MTTTNNPFIAAQCDQAGESVRLCDQVAQSVPPAMGNIADFPELQKAIREGLANGTLHAQGAQPVPGAPA